MIVLGTLGWWGFVYPELCLLETSYEEACEKETEEGLWDEEETEVNGEITGFDVVITFPGEDYKADREVHIKSKIAEYVYQIRSRKAEKDN